MPEEMNRERKTQLAFDVFEDIKYVVETIEKNEGHDATIAGAFVKYGALMSLFVLDLLTEQEYKSLCSHYVTPILKGSEEE